MIITIGIVLLGVQALLFSAAGACQEEAKTAIGKGVIECRVAAAFGYGAGVLFLACGSVLVAS